MDEGVPNARPPVALGCTVAAAALVVVVLTGIGLAVFLESGADDGDVTLDPVAAYAPGTYTRVAGEGFYVVNLDGQVFALADLDAANRAAQGRRCRVAPLDVADPALRQALDAYGDQRSPMAAGTTLVFYEACFGALYDAAGVRLDGPGPNLDRYEVDADDAGRLIVRTANRTCSVRSEAGLAEPAECSR
jgi:hypothetical protein